MTEFTYEAQNTRTPLERYEWDSVWIDRADLPQAGRVLYIGDSISRCNRPVATGLTGEKICFDNFASSKAVDNPWFAESLRLFAQQEGRRDLVIFNNGLHGWHLSEEEYARHYKALLQIFLEEFSGTPLALVLTTAVPDPDRELRVEDRNRAVLALAEKYGLPVIDLHGVSLAHADLRLPEDVHWTEEGCRVLSQAIVDRVQEIVPSLRF